MDTIGRYEILGELGRGACGVVYRGRDPGIGRTVAIKTIQSAHEYGDMLRERFRREARSAGNLSHPNIVTIYELNDSGEVMFIVMEFIDGATLAQRMSGRMLPLPFVLTIIKSAAAALDFAHAHNIVHRDVKPANFLITQEGHLKIADFGIAKMLDSDIELTTTGMVIGTAQYMSPEQVGAKEVTGRSDQFSLAVIAYELLTGQRPFQGDSWASVMHSIVANEPPPLNVYNRDLKDEVTEVLRKALAKDPKDRFTSCKEFAQALERALIGNAAAQQMFWEEASKFPIVPAETKTVVMPAASATAMPTAAKTKATVIASTTPTVIVPPARASSSKRTGIVLVAAVAILAIGLGAWFLLSREPKTQTAFNEQTRQTAPTNSAPLPPVAPTPAVKDEPKPVPVVTAEPRDQTPKVAAAPAAATTTPAPVVLPAATPTATVTAAAANTSVAPPPAITSAPPIISSPVQPTSTPKLPEPVPAAPAVTPTSPPPAPVATPQPPRAADVVDNTAQRRAAVAEAVNRYRQAFEARNIDGLKTVWPGLGRAEQTSFQNFFRIARTIRLQLTPIGEPEITATGAVATYRRTLNATDERGTLPAQQQTVKITFLKSGDQMLVDAVDVVGR